MSQSGGAGPAIGAHVRAILDFVGHRVYAVGAGGVLLHANAAARGPDGRVNELQARQLGEWLRPGACPKGCHVVHFEDPGMKYRLLVDTRGLHDPELAPRTLAALENLTPRQTEVLVRWARAWKEKRIAADLGVKVSTVKSHLKEIRAKLDARTKADVLARVRAFEAGMRPR